MDKNKLHSCAEFEKKKCIIITEKSARRIICIFSSSKMLPIEIKDFSLCGGFILFLKYINSFLVNQSI